MFFKKIIQKKHLHFDPPLFFFYSPSHIVDIKNIKCSLKKLYKKKHLHFDPPPPFFFYSPSHIVDIKNIKCSLKKLYKKTSPF